MAAIHEQVDRYLHQCFMVTYEPYIEVCRRLAELSPCHGEEQRSPLVNSGAEAVRNAVKIARAATGRPAVSPSTARSTAARSLTMTMTSKVTYRRGFGLFAPEFTARPARFSYRGVDTAQAIAVLEELFLREVDPESVACVVLEPVQGEGGFIVMPDDFPRALREVRRDCHGSSTSTTRSSRASPDWPGLGDRALRRRARPARLRQVARRWSEAAWPA